MRDATYERLWRPLIRNAQAIVTVDREDRVLRNGNILVEDNIIRYIGPEERAADRVIDASHCFCISGPGEHHHHPVSDLHPEPASGAEKWSCFRGCGPCMRSGGDWTRTASITAPLVGWGAAEIRLHHLHGPSLCV